MAAPISTKLTVMRLRLASLCHARLSLLVLSIRPLLFPQCSRPCSSGRQLDLVAWLAGDLTAHLDEFDRIIELISAHATDRARHVEDEFTDAGRGRQHLRRGLEFTGEFGV